MKLTTKLFLAVQSGILFLLFGCTTASTPDMILFNGKVITVDPKSTIAQAVAVKDGKITAVGSNEEIKKLAGKETQVIDVQGKTVVPGLNDAHLHPEMAMTSELSDKIPDLHNLADLYAWIKNETEVKKNGEWIIMPKMFFTRLKELRSNRDSCHNWTVVAPNNPVFLNGTYGGMINTMCNERIRDYQRIQLIQGFLKDKTTGELTGTMSELLCLS